MFVVFFYVQLVLERINVIEIIIYTRHVYKNVIIGVNIYFFDKVLHLKKNLNQNLYSFNL